MGRKINKNVNIEKAAAVIYFVNILQTFLFLGFVLYSNIFKDRAKIFMSENLTILFIILFIIFIMNMYISLRDINSLKKLNAQHLMQGKALKQIKDLNNTLRAQRHDFLNHLQVVYSLIEMNEYREVSNYIERVYEDIKKVDKVLKTSKPAINALLQAKLLDCEDKGILTELKITTRLDRLKVPSWEMCRVLGNLIDNAIDAAKRKEKGFIKVEISEELESYRFIVKNNGEKILENIRYRIFEPGFTTKGENGQGMGLAISKRIAHKYGGSIDVSSDESITVFEVIIPLE